MIDWAMLGANSLWIVGLAVLLAVFSYRSYLKSLGRDAGKAPDLRGTEPFLNLGLLLFALGQTGVSDVWWQRLLWALLSLWVAGSWAWNWYTGSVDATTSPAAETGPELPEPERDEPVTPRPEAEPRIDPAPAPAPGQESWYQLEEQPPPRIRRHSSQNQDSQTLHSPHLHHRRRSSRRTTERERWWDGFKLAVVVLLTLVQGGVYFTIMPAWQHYDEPGHFEYGWMLANQTAETSFAKANEDPTMQRETVATMQATNFYWNLPSPDLLVESRPVGLGFSQYSNPSLYYRLIALPLRLLSHLDLVSQLALGRLISLGFFLLTILCGAGLMWELTTPGHPLRWAVPLAIALVGPLADLMTAVNNDAGAIWIFTLLLWGSVRMIQRGLTPLTVLWVTGAALTGLLVKNTVALGLPLMALALIIALWRQANWSWRWFWALGSVGLLLTLVLAFSWQDARYWYHWDNWGTSPIQSSATRQTTELAPFGRHAAMVELDPQNRHFRLMNPLAPAAATQLSHQTITVAGWFWADQPMTAPVPTLLWGESGTTSMSSLKDQIDLTTTPIFVARTFEVAGDVGVAYFALMGPAGQALTQPGRLYVDGAVVAVGAFPLDQAPEFTDSRLTQGTWGGQPFTNLVRNPSAEKRWPRIWAPLERLIFRAVERSPTVLLAGLLDTQRTGAVLWNLTPRFLFVGMFSRFGWGHIGLPGGFWGWIFGVLLAVALGGGGWWLARTESVPGTPSRLPALLFLAGAGAVIWLSAMIWPISFLWADRLQLPSARYTFVAIAPIMLLITGGLYGLGRSQRAQLAILFGFLTGLLALDLLAIHTIVDFYRSLIG